MFQIPQCRTWIVSNQVLLFTVAFVICTQAFAAPFAKNSILVTSGIGDGRLSEFNTDGIRLQRFSFSYPTFGDDSSPQVKDILVSPTGDVHIISGDSDAYLITLDPGLTISPTQSQLSFSDFPFWKVSSNIAHGAAGIDKLGRVVVPDVIGSTNPLDLGGLYRFESDLSGGTHFGDPIEYARVAVGLDGFIYGLRDSSGAESWVVDVYDPDTLLKQSETNFSSAGGYLVNDLAIASDGGMYVAIGNSIAEVDGNWGIINQITPDTGGTPNGGRIVDIDINAEGTLIAGTGNGYVIVTDTELSPPKIFYGEPMPGSFGVVFVSFASSIPEPSSASLAVLGCLITFVRHPSLKTNAINKWGECRFCKRGLFPE